VTNLLSKKVLTKRKNLKMMVVIDDQLESELKKVCNTCE
jgi:hypothetical protein